MNATLQDAIAPRLIAPFTRSVQEVLATMVGLKTCTQPPVVKTAPAPHYDCSGLIGFSGDVVGMMSLSFADETARQVLTAFAGVPLEIGSADFIDALGELANVIAGNAKKDLQCNASITTPSVIIGPGHTIATPRDMPCVVIACGTSVGAFSLEVSLRQRTRSE